MMKGMVNNSDQMTRPLQQTLFGIHCLTYCVLLVLLLLTNIDSDVVIIIEGVLLYYYCILLIDC